ncbi:hypothetical protein [Streptomyces sp. NRRL B-1347]|uniref:hypothetical protein n=1 Tax=Streptomyces sp. NRRL B-1347 TaxID=1476877 RepID=UPI00131E75CD|nr:hypothetical protein [Streptomyces sp. NRRL B-1347]
MASRWRYGLNPGRGCLAATVVGFVSLGGALLWLSPEIDVPIDCGSKFVVEPPDSAVDVECRSPDSHSGQWHFMMPTNEVESWWAGQSDTPLGLRTWFSAGARMLLPSGHTSTNSGVSAEYPEDEEGLLWVNPKPGGMSEVTVNGAWF